jgi:hypothetical protein
VSHISFPLPQRLFIVVAAVHVALAVKPPNYVEKPKVPDKVSTVYLSFAP